MSHELVFLHVSDIHFRSRISGGVHDLDKDLRNELERDAHEVLGKVEWIDGILVSGDIGYAGLSGEYEVAQQWLRALCNKLGCPEQNVWTVPGNHDVDRQQVKQGKILNLFRQELRTVELQAIDEHLREWLSDRTTGPQLFSPLRNYIDFSSPFGCDVSVDQPSWRKDLELNDGSTLRLLGLNSCMISDELDNDGSHKLVVGTAQCRLEREEGVEYLVMSHHPPQWLREADSYTDLVNSRAHLQLYGHKHRQRIEQIDNTLRLYAGALHPDRKESGWEPRYNFLKCGIGKEGTDRIFKVDVLSRVWSETETAFVADRDKGGNEVRHYAFITQPWEGPESPTSETVASAPPKTTTAKVTTAKAKDLQMDPTRRLAYRFLTLPYSKKVEVALKLGLLKDEDRGAEDSDLYRRFFHRAKTDNLLADLWKAVESQYADGQPDANPFNR